MQLGYSLAKKYCVCKKFTLLQGVWTSTWKRSIEGRGVSKCTDFFKLTKSSDLKIFGCWESAEIVIMYICPVLTLPQVSSYRKADVFFCGESGQVNQGIFLLQIHYQVAGKHDTVVDKGCSSEGREPTCPQPGLGNVFPLAVVIMRGGIYGIVLWCPQHLHHESWRFSTSTCPFHHECTYIQRKVRSCDFCMDLFQFVDFLMQMQLFSASCWQLWFRMEKIKSCSPSCLSDTVGSSTHGRSRSSQSIAQPSCLTPQ